MGWIVEKQLHARPRLPATTPDDNDLTGAIVELVGGDRHARLSSPLLRSLRTQQRRDALGRTNRLRPERRHPPLRRLPRHAQASNGSLYWSHRGEDQSEDQATENRKNNLARHEHSLKETRPACRESRRRSTPW